MFVVLRREFLPIGLGLSPLPYVQMAVLMDWKEFEFGMEFSEIYQLILERWGNCW